MFVASHGRSAQPFSPASPVRFAAGHGRDPGLQIGVGDAVSGTARRPGHPHGPPASRAPGRPSPPSRDRPARRQRERMFGPLAGLVPAAGLGQAMGMQHLGSSQERVPPLTAHCRHAVLGGLLASGSCPASSIERAGTPCDHASWPVVPARRAAAADSVRNSAASRRRPRSAWFIPRMARIPGVQFLAASKPSIPPPESRRFSQDTEIMTVFQACGLPGARKSDLMRMNANREKITQGRENEKDISGKSGAGRS